MALRIVKAYEPMLVEQIIVALYGGPGFRKSTIAFTSDAPLCLDFDGGSYRAPNRKDTVPIKHWKDAALMQASDFAGYNTAIVDTAGRALDRLAEVLIAEDPKNSTSAGALSLQGYGSLKSTFVSWLNRLKGFGLDVILVSHASEERKGDDVIERLDIQGGSRGEVHKSADAMGRIYISGSETILNFSPSDAAFGKNPGNMAPLVFTTPEKDPRFLANVMTEIKRVLNSQSEAVRAMREKIGAALEAYSKLEGPEAFTAEAQKLSAANAEHAIKGALVQAAGLKGLSYDRTAKAFIVKPTETATPATAATTTSEDPAFFGKGRDAAQQGEPAAAASTGKRKQASAGRGRRAAG